MDIYQLKVNKQYYDTLTNRIVTYIGNNTFSAERRFEDRTFRIFDTKPITIRLTDNYINDCIIIITPLASALYL